MNKHGAAGQTFTMSHVYLFMLDLSTRTKQCKVYEHVIKYMNDNLYYIMTQYFTRPMLLMVYTVT